ncbi:MAG: hypothetical protein DMF63_02350 [Acidobacteria bacterium]|nr:MAG: hypothetical protein DMF63_02350 [Acidobacteriota bacterium]
MSAKHEKARSGLRIERFDAAEATALQAGTPAFQSHSPFATNLETTKQEPKTGAGYSQCGVR